MILSSKLRLIALLFFVFFQSTGLLAEVTIRVGPGFVGVVEYVDESGIMHLSKVQSHNLDLDLPENVNIAIWALEIDSASLALIAEGREVSCNLVQYTEEALRSNCAISLESHLLASGALGSLYIKEIARKLDLGKTVCSTSEKIFSEGNVLSMPWVACPRVEE